MAYAFNLSTNKYDLLGTKGTIPDVDVTVSFRLTKTVAKYVAGDGTVKLVIRSIVPVRFGSTVNQLSIGYAKARYSVQPTF